MSHILFITPKQPSTNPRMRKAADALSAAGHTVHVLYAFNTEWATKADEEILHQANWTYERIGGAPHEKKWSYHLSRLIRKIDAWRGHIEGAYCRSLKAFIRKGVSWKPDLIIGHNPGAIFPTLDIAKKLNIPSLFDAEDFYRGETNSSAIQAEITQLEDRWLNKFSHVTAAAPLIAKQYSSLYPKQRFSTINNAFPSHQIHQPTPVSGSLKVIWFSQVIGTDRGLVEFIKGLLQAPEIDIILTLIGSETDEFKSFIESQPRPTRLKIRVMGPLPESELFKILKDHHIGLAIEPGFSKNNQIARSNKLFSYLVTGCHIIATRTLAQLDFASEYEPSLTFIDLQNPSSIKSALSTLANNREHLWEGRLKNWKQGQSKVNWETESKKLINLIDQTLQITRGE